MNKYMVVILESSGNYRNQLYTTDKNMYELYKWIVSEQEEEFEDGKFAIPKPKDFIILNIVKLEQE